VHDAVDEDFLLEAGAGAGAFEEENASASEESDANQLPLCHLGPCEFGKNGIPAAQSTREGDQLFIVLPFGPFFLIYRLSRILCQVWRGRIWYGILKAHFSECSYLHYKMVTASWLS
jgi:hypothetical protein